MTSLRSLPTFLRTIDLGDGPDDGELLCEFASSKNEAAFAGLVRRHGRLVWTACRHLTDCEADADDAFQATFLVLFQRAKAVRDPARLSSWLYGVAAKVCGKLRQSRTRRMSRERRVALPESTLAVPDSAWDHTLAAVHEEVAKLPETLRIPFVMCCLDGQGVTDAAARLGWKLGTFSGRLTRAKDAILERLAKRGLALGAVAGVGLTVPPSSSVAAAISFTSRGSAVPSAILALAKGVADVTISTKTKLLAAAVLVTCGIGTIAGGGWVARAVAHSPILKSPESTNRHSDEDDTARLKALEAKRKAVTLEHVSRSGLDSAVFRTTKWEYDFVRVRDLDVPLFAAMLRDRENQHWEYQGTTPLLVEGVRETAWVYRRPARNGGGVNPLSMLLPSGQPLAKTKLKEFSKPNAERQNEFRTELRKLDDEISELKGQIIFYQAELPIPAREFAKQITAHVEKAFPSERCQIHTLSVGIALEAPKGIRDWAVAEAKKLNAIEGWKSKPPEGPSP